MAGTQQFAGDFSSQLHQLNGNHFYGPVAINTPDPKEVDGGFESSLAKDLSWDSSRLREGVIDRHTDGTCEWLFKSPAYLRWVDEHGLLLIRGNPGCGKSTLLKFALGRQLEGAASTGCLVMSFFFYSSGTELQNGIVGLTRFLLLQLCEQDVSSRLSFHEICRERWTAEGKKNECLKWHQNELQGIFERLVLECSTRRKTTIFVDAVDECRGKDRDRLIGLFHRLKGKAQMRPNKPRVCLTCRLYPDGQIDEDFIIRLEEKNQHDIQSFIEQELRLPDETESAVNNLKYILQIKAGGLFLWLVLVIQQVHDMSSKGLNLKFIESEILKCPRELDGLYEDLIKKIDDTELLEAGKLFQWICFGGRPLSLNELRTAMTVHLSGTKRSLAEYENESNPNYIMDGRKMKKRMIHLSRGLVDIADPRPAEGSSLIGFHHETIKSFMLTKGLRYLNGRLGKARSLAETAHFELANTCIDYLSTEEICTAFLEGQMHFPTRFFFLEYAATNWLAHAVEAEGASSGEHVTWPSQSTLDTWVSICRSSGTNPTQCPEEGTSLMHIAAEHGLERLAESIYGSMQQSTRPVKESQKRKKQGSKMQFAGAIPKVQKSISNAKNKAGESPLHLAARYGHIGMTRLLHGHGSEVAIRNQDGCRALYMAAETGHLEVVKFLYEHGADADIHIPTKNGWTPINAASENGHLEVVKFLYEHGADADVHTPTNDGVTPMYSASLNGHLEVVKFLYEHGADADVHTPTHNGLTPLHAASYHGHIEIGKLLLEKGANVTITNNHGWTPLHAAAFKGWTHFIKLLLEEGADINIGNKDGWTPLHEASYHGHVRAGKLLLEKGAGVNVADHEGRTPLYLASQSGHLEVVQLLLENRADVTVATNDGWTPVSVASRNGNIEVVKLLVEQGNRKQAH